jgi:hypothetical protein
VSQEETSETYRNMARDAQRRAEKAVSPNVRSRCMLLATQWNRRACELELAENLAPAGHDVSPAQNPDAPPARV